MGSSVERGLIPITITAAAAVACTYFYFLLFSEFALLRLAGGDTHAAQLTMSGLVLGGVAGSVVAAWRHSPRQFARHLGLSLLAGAALAALAPFWARSPLAPGWAAASGFALGCATVNLATGLRHWVPRHRLATFVGLGTGAAYALANVPPIFAASPATQSALAALVAAAGGLLCLRVPVSVARAQPPHPPTFPGVRSVAAAVFVFTALVWTDSTAFFVIQHSDTLREVTWSGSGVLWGNALMHFVAACLAGALIDRRHPTLVLGTAWLLLALACEALAPGSPCRSEARWAYTAGVSFYSTALVWWAAESGRPWIVALLFAVAGWCASALGIGMVQHLSLIPPLFLVASGTATALGLRRLGPRTTATVVLLLGLSCARPLHASPAVTLGRRVYIAEGCISCHSQYLRPNVPRDGLDWGPGASPRDQTGGKPPLIGDRRLGPDLSRVGLRRTPEWNRLHLIAPRSIDAGSCMPSYAALFQHGNPQGPALVAYLASLGQGLEQDRQRQIDFWRPSPASRAPPSSPSRGRRLWSTLCAGCHGADGRGDGPAARSLDQRPPDFSAGRWTVLAPSPQGAVDELELLRLIKFGIAGTPMAGHEYLGDADLRALAARVAVLHASQIHEDSHRRG